MKKETNGEGSRFVTLIEGAALQLRRYTERARELEAEILDGKRKAVKRLSELEGRALAAEDLAQDSEQAAREAADILRAVAEAVERELARHNPGEVDLSNARRAA